MSAPSVAAAEPRPTGRVVLLDPHTVNQIAAGEVVERPASVVKELVENALDADATRVTVELEGAGRRRIAVVDDGCGMTAEDAATALLRHATSKIRTADDLARVATMGFRGEALPSIASVARLTLATGLGDGVRHVREVDGGDARPARATAGPRGTTVTVEDLFGRTPARLKFLKTDATELSACVEAVSKLALARPDVAFTLRHGGGTLLETTGSGDLATAVAEVWGREVAGSLVPIDQFTGGVRVRGFVSPPHFTRPTRAYQWFYVNGRSVRSRTVAAALDQAYRSLTPERRFPVALLSLESDPAGLDVNVSPTKSEVKFHHEGAAFDAVRRAVRGALLAQGMVPTAADLAAVNEALRPGTTPGAASPLPFPGADGAGPRFGAYRASAAAQAPLGLEGASCPRPVDESGAGDGPEFLRGLRVLGQMDETFILAENHRGLLIVDQHVAHERVLYEHLQATRGAGAVEAQPLLSPETIHLDRRLAEALAARLDELRSIGFDLEPFGGESFLVRSVPAVWRGKAPIALLRDLAEELADGLGHGCLTAAREEVFILASCKLAVKAGDPLGLPEMERLLQDLAGTENPYLCPHGRPITIVVPKGDLYRKFKR